MDEQNFRIYITANVVLELTPLASALFSCCSRPVALVLFTDLVLSTKTY